MRIKAIMEGNQWVVTPEDGTFKGIRIGKADGLALKAVAVDGLTLRGEVTSVWGLEIEEGAIFNDPKTVKGLRIGQPFDMRKLHEAMPHEGTLVITDTGAEIREAATLWVMGSRISSYGEVLQARSHAHPAYAA